jgi:hypothetical protein
MREFDPVNDNFLCDTDGLGYNFTVNCLNWGFYFNDILKID